MDHIKNEVRLTDNGIYCLSEAKEFSYNDGDREESYVHSVIERASDLSSTSNELEKWIRDWPSRYHLSKERANCYRALKIKPGLRILEVGSGCGAITRYLGETGAKVMALEGSRRRAIITKERVRDLDNVTVICAPFDVLQFDTIFDLVICNGVFEYSPLFVKGDDPFDAFLAKCSALMSQNGALVVAIENQFGLRYFSSSKEEHTNVMYDGLHGYVARGSSAKTFSMPELRTQLEDYFGKVITWLPVPDYKLPGAVLSEKAVEHINPGEMVADFQKYDFGASKEPLLHERLVYHELGKSCLLNMLSNSLFMIAGPGAEIVSRQDWLGSFYKEVCGDDVQRRVDLTLSDNNEVRVVVDAGDEGIVLQNDEKWVGGVSFHTLLSKAFCKKKNASPKHDINPVVSQWWNAVELFEEEKTSSIRAEYIDAIWRNVKIADGKIVFFDQERLVDNPFPAYWLIYRAVCQFYRAELAYVKHWNWRYRLMPPFIFMCMIGDVVGVRFGMMSLLRSIDMNCRLMSRVKESRLSKAKCFLSAICPLFIRKWKKKFFLFMTLNMNRILARLGRTRILGKM